MLFFSSAYSEYHERAAERSTIKGIARSDGNVSWIDSIISKITGTYKVSRLHASEYSPASSSQA